MIKVSVIIPVYNTEKYLRKCLDSVCSQTLKDIEIICVNDCSPDNSLDILREYAENDDRIKIIDFAENKGAAAARNAGIDLARGEYLGFVDSDDFVDLDFYEKLYDKAVETDADIIKSNLVMENPNYCNVFGRYANLDATKLNKLNFNHIPTAIVKTEFINNHNIRFNEMLRNAEDCVFEVMMSFFANKIEIIEDVAYHYLFNTSSLNNTHDYSIEKIKNLALSLDCIVEFLNQNMVPFDDYKEVVLKRGNSTIQVFQDKYDGTLDTLNFFENAIRKIENKLNFDLHFEKCERFALLRKICLSREAQKVMNEREVIPKKVFYVWFGDKKPNMVHMCIENWKDKLKGFEFIEVGEKSPYFDFQHEYKTCRWFREVYDRKLWAFVSDYVRVKVLFENGGIYLDTDITFCKDITPLSKNIFFIGEEHNGIVGVGIFGTIPFHPYLKKVLDFYQNKIYESSLYTIPSIFTEIFEAGQFDDVVVYPKEYFYAFRYGDEFNPKCLTKNSYTIHWWAASWLDTPHMYFLKNKHKVNLIRQNLVNKIKK